MKTPWWFLHKTPISLVLLPVSFIYYAASRAVYNCRRIGAYTPRRPVVCFGNILAGGVGKTPIVRAVATHFDAPVVMRGYKSKSSASRIGDEAAMLSQSGIQVHTGDRRSNVMLLDRQSSNAPIILDDGFQNPTDQQTISVLVFDAALGYGNGFLLPAGPLREGRRAIARADAVLIIDAPKNNKNFTIPVGTTIFHAKNKTINPYGANEKIVAFAGIGYPQKFFAAINGNVVATRKFPDHYQYTDADLEKLFKLADKHGAKLLTTEKDWVRLPADAREKIKFASLETQIDDAFFKWLGDKLK